MMMIFVSTLSNLLVNLLKILNILLSNSKSLRYDQLQKDQQTILNNNMQLPYLNGENVTMTIFLMMMMIKTNEYEKKIHILLKQNNLF